MLEEKRSAMEVRSIGKETCAHVHICEKVQQSFCNMLRKNQAAEQSGATLQENLDQRKCLESEIRSCV